MPPKAAVGEFFAKWGPVRNASEEAQGPSTAQNLRVLLVEDDFVVAADLEHELTKAGFQVIGPAATAEEAIELARRMQPALAIVDIRLAGERDGIDAALQLFRDFKIRALFATAHSDAATRARAEPASPLGWLAKPYSSGALIEAVKRATEH